MSEESEIKEAMIKRYHYDRCVQMTAGLPGFINARNYGWCPKALRGLAPYKYIRKRWTKEPERFSLSLRH